MRLIQRGGIGHPLAALFRGKGIDEEMRRADQAFVHGRRGLDGQQCIDQGLVETAAKLGEGFGQYTVGLRTAKLDVFDATGIHHRHVGTQPLTDRFIGGTHFVFQQFQRQEHTRWHGVATAGRTFGKRLATLCSMASTIAAQGKVSAIGGWNWCRERCRQPEGGGRFHRANAEGGVEDALRGLLLAGVKMPQDTTIHTLSQSPLCEGLNNLGPLSSGPQFISAPQLDARLTALEL